MIILKQKRQYIRTRRRYEFNRVNSTLSSLSLNATPPYNWKIDSKNNCSPGPRGLKGLPGALNFILNIFFI